jgi:hypothetical protein
LNVYRRREVRQAEVFMKREQRESLRKQRKVPYVYVAWTGQNIDDSAYLVSVNYGVME